jgi:hypothetical protein
MKKPFQKKRTKIKLRGLLRKLPLPKTLKLRDRTKTLMQSLKKSKSR